MPQGYAMNGGNGPQSYAQNSSYQRGAVDVAKELIKEEIDKELDVKQLSSTSVHPFRIADFGCSTGPNTFVAMKVIREALEEKLRKEGLASEVPEFQVFFNDHISNDFNTLFASLPPERHYLAAGVPGDFHKVLLPKASLHFAHSSCSLHWLSDVPKEVTDNTSPAWNKGKIHHGGAKKKVLEVYASQFANDLESFLNARAHELVDGGLMALVIPAVPDAIRESQTTIVTEKEFEVLGSCLMDLAKKGLVDELKVNMFNLPLYLPSPNEIKTLMKANEHLNVQRMEILSIPGKHVVFSNPSGIALYLRAALEGLLEKQFGSDIMDELFELFTQKLAESSSLFNPENQDMVVIFVLLKRKLRT
ncbi:probable S-adenosylmethionine-dependent methyltransferase At5g37990 [Coffea eugenioides]|uniref:probable S-adenosylmethionine-dependent methyltransferase At5g37990 n=1 Tax=Coffea eugenioides TaxID=49369 RepID=UPI000F60BB4D|nr:probable S-adenosylmethionine-dependent methyltransferase At5g37990 [Coffea eugenioides]